MEMGVEKWGKCSSMNAEYPTGHQQPRSRKYSHRSEENQAMDEEASVACHLLFFAMKKYIIMQAFVHNPASETFGHLRRSHFLLMGERVLQSIAFPFKCNDVGMVDQPVHQSSR